MRDLSHDIVSERRQCYDPRDRFFALYSMVDGVEKKYPINYENEADEIALQITLWILVYECADSVLFAHTWV
ncbi:hypothetical protein BJX99DRAFT_232580 [Aspergillus californicus]